MRSKREPASLSPRARADVPALQAVYDQEEDQLEQGMEGPPDCYVQWRARTWFWTQNVNLGYAQRLQFRVRTINILDSMFSIMA